MELQFVFGKRRERTCYSMNDDKMELLISAIQERPELWMASHPLHKNRVITKQKWTEIAEIVEMEVTEVKKKWKYLRDQYRKELKKKPISRSGASRDDTEWVPQWKYYNLMRFLQDEVIPAPSSGNLSNPSNPSHDSRPMSSLSNNNGNDDINDERTIESCPSGDTNRSSCDSAPRRSLAQQRNDLLTLEKEKLELIKARIQDKKDEKLEKDEDYMFFMSMLPTFKRLSNLQKLRFRHKVSEMMLEMTSQNEYVNVFDNDIVDDYVLPQPEYLTPDSHSGGGSLGVLPSTSSSTGT